MLDVPSATRANLPRRYAFSFVSAPPPKTPTASCPCRAWISLKRCAIKSRASSQLEGSSRPPELRTSGVRSRSGCPSGSAADQPLTQSAPLFTGNERLPLMANPPGPQATRTPHWRAQYGQCVAVGTTLMRAQGSKTHSDATSPEVPDNAVISGAFGVSDWNPGDDENVPHQRFADRKVHSTSS